MATLVEYCIDAPHFYVGLAVSEDKLVLVAPPIVRYMLGWDIEKVTKYCSKKGWKVICLSYGNIT